MFFTTFRDNILNKDLTCDPIFRDPQFRRFVINSRGKNLETVKFLSDPLKLSMKKPQRCLHDDTDYYLGLDTYSKTYYICYRNLLMIDIDLGKDDQFLDREAYLTFLKAYSQQHPELLFDVYQSRNGLHLFALHKKYDYSSDEALGLMIDLHCDFYYIVYTHIRGWSVRLNRKFKDSTGGLYHFVTRVGSGVADNYLEKLVTLHLNFSELFADREVSLMK